MSRGADAPEAASEGSLVSDMSVIAVYKNA